MNGASFDISHTAFLAMDCQTGIVSFYAKPQEEFIARASTVVRAARTAGIDGELHQALLTRLFPKRAEVLLAADFVKQLG